MLNQQSQNRISKSKENTQVRYQKLTSKSNDRNCNRAAILDMPTPSKIYNQLLQICDLRDMGYLQIQNGIIKIVMQQC